MAALDRITIWGYKSIKDATIELRPLNVLVGANGAGKSNFVGAVRFLKAARPYSLREQGKAEYLLHYGIKQTRLLAFLLRIAHIDFLAAWRVDEFGDLFLSVGELSYAIVGGKKVVWASPAYGALLSEPSESKIRHRLSFPEEIEELLDDVRVYHFHDTSSTAAVKQPSALNDNVALRADAGNLSAFLYLLREKHRENYDQIVSLVRRVVPRFDDFALRPDPLNPDHIQLEWREVESDFPFRAPHLSDGSLRFICLATLLMQPEPPSTVIIDEPELGLHPVAIELLAEMLRQASQRTQVIVATQSPALVSAFTPEDIITVDREEGASVFRRHTTESLTGWLEDYTLGELWEKNVIGGKP